MNLRLVVCIIFLMFYTNIVISKSPLIKWKFNNGKIEGYIIPSLHYTSIKFDTVELQNILDEVGSIYFETSKGDEDTNIKNLFLCEISDKCINGINFSNLWGKIENRFKKNPDMLSRLSKLKLWAIAMFIGQDRNIGKSNLGLEHQILVLNSEYNHPVSGLQTRTSLFQQFDSLSSDAQLLMLNDSLVNDEVYFEKLNKLSSAWSIGCEKCLCEMANNSLNNRPEYAQKIVYERNQNWANRVSHLNHQEPILIVVGAAHLCGEDSFLSALSNSGFTVK